MIRMVTRRGLVIPEDLTVSVGAVDGGWSFGRCSYVVTVSVTGPVRVHYAMEEPASGEFLLDVPVAERRRRRTLRAVVASGALYGARDLAGPVGAAGWFHAGAGAGEWMVWIPLPQDRRLGGVAVFDSVTALVGADTWRQMYAMRQRAWDEWVNRTQYGRSARGGADGPTTLGQTRGDDADEHVASDVRVAGRPQVRYPVDELNGGPGYANGARRLPVVDRTIHSMDDRTTETTWRDEDGPVEWPGAWGPGGLR